MTGMLNSVKDGPIGALVLAGVATIGIIVLSALGHPIPTELTVLDTALVGGALGISNPTSTARSPTSAPVDQA